MSEATRETAYRVVMQVTSKGDFIKLPGLYESEEDAWKVAMEESQRSGLSCGVVAIPTYGG